MLVCEILEGDNPLMESVIKKEHTISWVALMQKWNTGLHSRQSWLHSG